MKKSIMGIMIVILLSVISVMPVLATEGTEAGNNEDKTTTIDLDMGNGIKISVKLNFDGNDLTKGELKEWLKMNYDKPEREYYTFDGWWIENAEGEREEIKFDNNNNADSVPNNTTVYAHWGGCAYTVEFIGGDLPASLESKTVNYGEPYGNLPKPVASDNNWNFLGWFTEDGIKIEDTTLVNLKDDDELKLYARWSKELNIEFVMKQITTSHKITILKKDTYTYLELLEELLPIITDSNFLRWSIDPTEGTVDWGDAIDVNANKITVHAIWKIPEEPNAYTITFISNYDTNREWTQTIEEGYKYGILPILKRENHIFRGWYTEEDGGEEISPDDSPCEDKTLYAQWEKVYTITLALNGGECSESTRSIPESGTYRELPTPTREKHTFQGWFTEEEGGEQINLDNSPDDDKTVYAHWKENEYTITFNLNGGSCNESERIIKASESYGTLPTPTRKNHTFLGWFTEISSGRNVESVDSPGKNITLYAHWQPIVVSKTHKITLNPKGGTCENKEKEVAAGYTCKGSELETPTRKGYVFVGWKNGSTVITKDDTLTVDKDLTLEAIWVGTLQKKNVKVSCYQWATEAEISWNTVDGATEYQISYKKKGEKDSKYIKLATVKNPKNKKTLKTRITKKSKMLKNNTQYIFKVEACYKTGKKILKPGTVAVVSHKTKPAIGNITLTREGNLYRLKWKKLDNEVERLEIYTNKSKSIFFEPKKGATQMSVGINRVAKGTKFRIKVYYKPKGQKRYCDYSKWSAKAN